MDLNNSIIIIDKPPGMICHEVTTNVKKITGVSRAGHAGTLDPDVSGVLPVALGRATRLLRYIAGKDKSYVGIMKFREPKTEDEIRALFLQFTGELVQTPPRISAVRKKARKRKVHYLKLLEIKGRLALFETRVDAGTYIRTLCDDIGKACGGARMEELRRIAVGDIREEQAATMQQLTDAVWFYKNKKPAMLENMAHSPELFIDLPKASIRETALKSIFSGAQIMMPAIESMERAEAGQRVALYCKERFIGVGIVQPSGSKGPVIKLERVHR